METARAYEELVDSFADGGWVRTHYPLGLGYEADSLKNFHLLRPFGIGGKRSN